MDSSLRSAPCVYCGDTPVSHAAHYFEASVSTFIAALNRPRFKPRARLLQLDRSELIRWTTHLLAELLIFVRALKISDNPSYASSSRTKSIWNEARRRNIEMQELSLFGQKRDFQRAWLPIREGSATRGWHYFSSIPLPPWRSQHGLGMVDDKHAFKRVLLAHGLPVPEGRSVRTVRGALKLMACLGSAVITKPREGSRGRHTTVNITSPKELAEAFVRAGQLSPFVMVEEYVPGRVYRATCVAGKTIGIMELVRPVVVADGIMTADELRRKYNASDKAFPTLTDVDDTEFFRTALIHQGFTPQSVPAASTTLLLAELSERVNGGYFVDCTDEVPASTLQTIDQAARTCGIDVVGFDIISKDLTNRNERFVFIEGNSLPYIEIHDIPYAGSVRNVSSAIFDLWNV